MIATQEGALGASLQELAGDCHEGHRYAEAEALYVRALNVKEKASVTEALGLAKPLKGLANVYVAQSRYAEAEPIFKRLIAITETSLGPEHPDAAEARKTLARFYQTQGRYADAESVYERQLELLHGFDDVQLGLEAVRLLLSGDAFFVHPLREKSSSRQEMA